MNITKEEPPPRNAVTRSNLVAVLYSLNIQNTETSNMFLNKHYVVPFVKECVARFPLSYSDNDRHRLNSVTRDVTSEVKSMHSFTSQLAGRLMACKQKYLCMLTQPFYDLQCQFLSLHVKAH